MYVIRFNTMLSLTCLLFQLEDYYIDGTFTKLMLLMDTVAWFMYCFTSNLLGQGACSSTPSSDRIDQIEHFSEMQLLRTRTHV